MKKFVRDSKFRHVYGNATPKDQQFEGINASSSRLDGNIVACNRKFIAVALLSSGGGIFTVLNRKKPGRYEKLGRCIGHTSEVVDLAFDPFNPNRVLSGGEDGMFIVWWIPEEGTENDINEYQAMLRGSQKRAVQGIWHKSAADVVFCVNIDAVTIFNLKTVECIIAVDTTKYSDQLFNITLNYDSSQFAVACKDKKIRVFDSLKGTLLNEFMAHEGSKPMRVEWLTNIGEGQYLISSGATRMSERQISVWDTKTGKCMATEDIDNASGVISLFYDHDTNLFAAYSKGEVTCRIFEIEQSCSLFLVSVFQSTEQQRAGAFGNKISCNIMGNEVMHFARVLTKSIEEVAFIVPRRSDQFQDDLFPDCPGEEAALSVEDFISGKLSKPKLISLRDYVPSTSVNPVLSNVAATLVGSQRSQSTGGTKGSAVRPPSFAGNFEDVGALKKKVEELSNLVNSLEERINALENKS